MKAIELSKSFDPKEFEDRIYEAWMREGLFGPKASKGMKSFVVVMPPPNVTGVLHMGHGLNNSLQDIIVRYHRMRGVPTLWVPGTDHAGIATQHVVEKRLRKEGKSRHDLGREAFVDLTWKVKEEHHAIIKKQLEKIGASCDWTRERFTMDEGLSRAVRETFVLLYERGLIYRGKYLVNWCASCGTALSDDEVEHDEEAGSMHHIYYELVSAKPGEPSRLEIATTRPETLLGDTAVAVHPEDERYKGLVGRMVRLPLAGREIPIVADSFVDREFGTGAVKITPAHDPNDWAVAERHGLPKINILSPDGRLNDEVPAKYRGLKVKEARTAVVEDLKALGLYKEEKPIKHSVGHCYRCSTVIEPYMSEQWFVKMKPLAEKALKAWRDGDIRFYPQRWENTYAHWMENIRDWCISRQLWWGHRIPVWYCRHCGLVMVEREEPTICPKCKSTDIYQDEDVLDTWFSSWLWPFSTLGWPKDTADLRNYYPTTALVTAYDIIFFWVSRMIMAGLEFMGRAPFRDIYITTLVRDKQGRKMSKSLGNGIDPLEIVDEYGADALKFTLAFMTSQGQDVLIDKESFKLGSKFVNKVWNASRYLLMKLEDRELISLKPSDFSDIDLWIHARLNRAAAAIKDAFSGYRFNDAAQAAYEYFWNDFCDWYIEATKPSFSQSGDREKDRAISMLIALLEESLRLLHPFIPLASEEIYQKLPGKKGWLIEAPYPQPDPAREAPEIEEGMARLQEYARLSRNLRAEFGLPQGAELEARIKLDSDESPARFILAHADLAATLSGTRRPVETASLPFGGGWIRLPGPGFELALQAGAACDAAALHAKFTKELEREGEYATRIEAKLAGSFSTNAPADVVAKEREKLDAAKARCAKLAEYLRELAG